MRRRKPHGLTTVNILYAVDGDVSAELPGRRSSSMERRPIGGGQSHVGGSRVTRPPRNSGPRLPWRGSRAAPSRGSPNASSMVARTP